MRVSITVVSFFSASNPIARRFIKFGVKTIPIRHKKSSTNSYKLCSKIWGGKSYSFNQPHEIITIHPVVYLQEFDNSNALNILTVLSRYDFPAFK